MYHISDLKKFIRCPRLYVNDTLQTKKNFQPFVRLDEELSTLVSQKLKVDGKVFVGNKGDDASLAIEAMKECDWLIKARFEYQQLRVKIPFLHRTNKGLDIYFLYVGLYPHADDMTLYCDDIWVLKNLGIEINQMYIVHLNANYVREETLDVEQLFVVSDSLYNGKNNPTITLKEAVKKKYKDITPILQAMDEQRDTIPEAVLTNKCTTRQKCPYFDACFPYIQKEPDNSILTLIASQHKHAMKEEGILYLKDADINRVEGTRQQFAQIRADQLGGLYVDQYALSAWLEQIQYPICFLDFEWERFAIPPYKGMKPYDVLPFEYSIHILEKDGTITHKVYLNIQDDRLDMTQNLVKDIPETGSIIAYNAFGAETIRIAELAKQFPQYASQLLHMNERMEDLQLVFENGTVYDTRMKGQWSLKVIMAMMNDKSYKDLDIAQGMEAVFQWRHLDTHDETVDKDKIVEDLKKYCGMDSYAMTVVYKWLLQLKNEKNETIDIQ